MSKVVVGVVIGCALAVPSGHAAPSVGAKQILAVKEFDGTLRRRVSWDTTTTPAAGMACATHVKSEMSVRVKLVFSHRDGEGACWKGTGRGRLDLIRDFQQSARNADAFTQTDVNESAQGDAKGSIELCVSPENDTWTFDGGLDESVTGKRHDKTVMTGFPGSESTRVERFDFEDLGAPKGPVRPIAGGPASLKGQRVETLKMTSPCDGSQSTAKFEEIWDFTGKSVKAKAFIDPPVETKLLPEPGKAFTLPIRWTDAPATAIEVTFEAGAEPGRYLNDVNGDREADFDIAPGRWSVTPLGGTDAKTFKATLDTIDEAARRAELPVIARDYGAYGTIRARVKINGDWVDATTKQDQLFERVPYDLNGNRVADEWEKQEGVAGKPADWDEDPLPAGITVTGDSLSLYEEYRGLMVVGWRPGNTARSSTWRRLKPKLREVIVDDDAHIVRPDLWKAATGVEMVIVDGPHYSRRIANYRHGFAHPRDAYVVKVDRVDGVVGAAGYGPVGARDTTIDATTVGGTFPGTARSPKDVVWCAVFTGNIASVVRSVPTGHLHDAVSGADTDGARALRGRFPMAYLRRAAAALRDPAVIAKVIEQQVNATVIHELGHAVGIPHHGKPDEAGSENGGDPTCPMRYGDALDNASMFVVESMFGAGDLPKGVGKMCTRIDNSESRIRLKD